MNRQQLLALAKGMGHEGAELMDNDKFVRNHRIGVIAKAEGEGLGKVGSQMMNIDREIRRRLQSGADNARLNQLATQADKAIKRGLVDNYVNAPQSFDDRNLGSEEARMQILLQGIAQREDAGVVARMLEAAGGPGAKGAAVRYGVPLGMTAAGAGLISIMQNLGEAEETAMVRSTPGAELK